MIRPCLSSVQVQQYLKRIGLESSMIEPTFETLHTLHKQHLRSIPYENFDIIEQKPLNLSIDALFEKIVRNKRGGFCYELNILFASLLQSLGFGVEFLSANLWKDEQWGPQYDHCILNVTCPENQQKKWIADVGNARWFQEPMLLSDDSELEEYGYTYHFTKRNDVYFFTKKECNNEESVMQYRFTNISHKSSEFVEICRWKETASESWFTQNIIYSIATPAGRKILSDTQFTYITNGERKENIIGNFSDFSNVLFNQYQILYSSKLKEFWEQKHIVAVPCSL